MVTLTKQQCQLQIAYVAQVQPVISGLIGDHRSACITKKISLTNQNLISLVVKLLGLWFADYIMFMMLLYFCPVDIVAQHAALWTEAALDFGVFSVGDLDTTVINELKKACVASSREDQLTYRHHHIIT